MGDKARHIVNISGGKDSAATALLAADLGRPFDLWMADTDNENQITVDYAYQLAEFLGKPLNKAKADFSKQLEGKRKFVSEKWALQGVPQSLIDRALLVLKPSGNAFLDLCIWKGRFPSRKAQFCTEFLKAKAIEDACVAPLLQHGPVVQWLGVRRDESLKRRNAPMFQKVRRYDFPHNILLFRPIIHWTAQNVFSYAKSKGLPPNPLYMKGFGRVGCFPCINTTKAELKLIGRHSPEVIERLAEWEAVVAMASKQGRATFFAPDVTPEGAAIVRWAKKRGGMTAEESARQKWPDAAAVFEWAKTGRGGRQFDMLDMAFADDGLSCSSQYGLCE